MGYQVDIEDVGRVQTAIMLALKDGKLANDGECESEYEVMTSTGYAPVRDYLLASMGLKAAQSDKADAVYLFADQASPFAVDQREITSRLNNKLKSEARDSEGKISGSAVAAIVFVALLKTFFETGTVREYIPHDEFARRVDDYVDEIITREEDSEEKSDLALAASAYRAKLATSTQDATKDKSRITTKMGMINALVGELSKMDLFILDRSGNIRPTERFRSFVRIQVLSIRNKPMYEAFFKKGDDVDA